MSLGGNGVPPNHTKYKCGTPGRVTRRPLTPKSPLSRSGATGRGRPSDQAGRLGIGIRNGGVNRPLAAQQRASQDRIKDVDAAIKAIRTDLIDRLPKLHRSGRVITKGLSATVTAATEATVLAVA